MTTETDREARWRQLADAHEALEEAVRQGDARARDDARLAFDAAHARLDRDFAALTRAGAPTAPGASASLHAQLYPYPGEDAGEVAAGGAALPLPLVGVCLSGGGSRSASASMGALRALRYLGLLDKVGIMSTVSGGGWAGVPFTWCPDAIDDDELLGPLVLDPARLSWSDTGSPELALDVLSDRAIGSLCRRVGVAELMEEVIDLYFNDVPVDALWNRAIGRLVLEPFGLGDKLADGRPTMYYSYTDDWRDRVVLAANPGLAARQFYTVQAGAGRSHRPYLVTNSTFFYPPPADSGGAVAGRSRLVDPGMEPYPFEATPTVAGIPPAFAGAGRDGRNLGGGFIDPFAFGSEAPPIPPADRRFSVPTPPARFALSDIAGTSSSAYVDVLIQWYCSYFDWVQDLDPSFRYWPVAGAGTPANTAARYLFGDGGILENTGIMALLRRRVRNVIAFVNCSQPIDRDSQGVVIVDDMLPPLFGLQPYNPSDDPQRHGYRPLQEAPGSLLRHNQVFERAAFAPLLQQLWQAAVHGQSCLHRQDGLKVLANARFGIAGGDTVNVLWIYNNPVPAWERRLQPRVLQQMREEFWRFGNFPNYDTVLQLNLGARQVNLLAHLTAWNVASDDAVPGRPGNRALVQSMFT